MGVLALTAKDKVRLLPPLNISIEEIDKGLEILLKACEQYGKDGSILKEYEDKAYLILADGTLYEGYSVGAKGTAVGEVVFQYIYDGLSGNPDGSELFRTACNADISAYRQLRS